MVKTRQQTELSETTTSYEVRVELSSEKSFEDYLREYREHRDRVTREMSATGERSVTASD